MVQIFQKGIEAVGDFGQLRVLNFKSHRVAKPRTSSLVNSFIPASLA